MDYTVFPLIPVLLERSNVNQAWGFCLQGGVDFRLPLSVKKVTSNSPAHNKLHPGDGIASIAGRDTTSMKHEEAIDLIRNALQLQIVLRRGQVAPIRPARAAIKFTAASTTTPVPNKPYVGSALTNTTTTHNYRRF